MTRDRRADWGMRDRGRRQRSSPEVEREGGQGPLRTSQTRCGETSFLTQGGGDGCGWRRGQWASRAPSPLSLGSPSWAGTQWGAGWKLARVLGAQDTRGGGAPLQTELGRTTCVLAAAPGLCSPALGLGMGVNPSGAHTPAGRQEVLRGPGGRQGPGAGTKRPPHAG